MPPSVVHTNAVLTDFAVEYMQSAAGMVAERLFPTKKVNKRSDIYKKYDIKNRYTINSLLMKRSPGTPARDIHWEAANETYATEKFGLRDFLEDEDIENADPPLALRTDSSSIISDLLMLNRESEAMTIATTAANYPTNSQITGGADWDTVTVDSRVEVNDGINNLLLESGLGNPMLIEMIMPWDVFRYVRISDVVEESIKYTKGGQAKNITAQELADFYGIGAVHIAGSVQNSAVPGKAVSMAYLWPDDVVLFHNPPTPRLKGPQFGLSFANKLLEGKNYREEALSGEWVEHNWDYDQKIVANEYGAHIDNVLS